MKKYFILIIASILLIPFSKLLAQEKINEGKITYAITYPEMEMDKQMEAVMPTESIVYFKSHLSRSETSMGMGLNSVTIMNSKTNEVISLMDMLGTKTATKMKEEDTGKSTKKFSIELKDESKEIAGYVCKKAILKMDDETQFEMFYTDAINSSSQFNRQWKELDGFPMEYQISTNGFNIKMTAKSISKEKVPASLFEVPSDYKLVTQEEYTKMMGGQ